MIRFILQSIKVGFCWFLVTLFFVLCIVTIGDILHLLFTSVALWIIIVIALIFFSIGVYITYKDNKR